MVSFNLLSSASHCVWRRCAGKEVEAKCVPPVIMSKQSRCCPDYLSLSGVLSFLIFSIQVTPEENRNTVNSAACSTAPCLFLDAVTPTAHFSSHTSCIPRTGFSSFARVSLPVVCFSQIYKSHDILHTYIHTIVCRFSFWDKKRLKNSPNQPSYRRLA